MLLREIDDFKLPWTCSIEMLRVLAFRWIEILRSLRDQAFGFGWGEELSGGYGFVWIWIRMDMDMVFREADSRI